jgi:glycosyltransferase involved in cell wall biosynthesis
MCLEFSRIGYEVFLFSYGKGERGLQESESLNHPIRHVRLLKSNIPIFNFIFDIIAALKVLIIRPNILHGRDNIRLLYMCSFFSRSVSYEFHTNVFSKIGKRSTSMLSKIFRKKNFRSLVVTSRELKSAIEFTNRVPIGKICILYNAASIPIVPSAKIDKSKINIGYIGHLYRGKGVEMVVELARARAGASFHVIGGECEDLQYWRLLCANIENIKFYGHMNSEQCDEYRQAFDILLLPLAEQVTVAGGHLESSRWMVPIKLFEYMISGNPIIASKTPPIQEVLGRLNYKYLCEPGSLSSWLQALDVLISDKGLRDSLGETLRLEARTYYTWKKRAEAVIQLHEEHL